jgi:hypothetical protein
MNVGDIVVHKSSGNVPMVVVHINDTRVDVRYGTQSQNGFKFITENFLLTEVESPEESIDREAKLFEVLTKERERLAVANSPKKGPVPVN